MRCKIRWVTEGGVPTHDENEAVGYARCLGYKVAENPNFKPEPSKWYPICEGHLKMMPLDGVWEFVREVPK